MFFLVSDRLSTSLCVQVLGASFVMCSAVSLIISRCVCACLSVSLFILAVFSCFFMIARVFRCLFAVVSCFSCFLVFPCDFVVFSLCVFVFSLGCVFLSVSLYFCVKTEQRL